MCMLRRCAGFGAVSLVIMLAGLAAPAHCADTDASPRRADGATHQTAGVDPSRPGRWAAARRTVGRLTNKQLGLVINTSDPYSLEVGEFYAVTRALSPDQILRVALPVKPSLTPEEFTHLDTQIRKYFGRGTQALALAWTLPYAVSCNSITAAVTLGFDGTLCAHTCSASSLSPYFNSATTRPFSDLHIRPSMMLAAHTSDEAKAMISRGRSSDATLGLRGALPVQADFVITPDPARNVRAALYPPTGKITRAGIEVNVLSGTPLSHLDRVMLYQTGATRVENTNNIGWVPGALADHLTSSGGQLNGSGDQMSILQWIASGATASYGTVSEPCNHVQKFPHPQLLLQYYAQGATAIEAYWRSVAWPQQGVFVGEPLAAPFSRR